MIDKFRGNFYYLSNFYNAPITWEGLTYKNNESAFQSAKLLDINKRLLFTNLNANDAKRKGRRVQLRPDWEKVKIKIMYDICYAKFTQNQYLKDKLLSTGNEYLIEGNDWNDTFWGVCNGRGYNNLGKILMQVRNDIKKGGIFMSNGCDGCPLKDDPNACKTMCARDHKRENDRERE